MTPISYLHLAPALVYAVQRLVMKLRYKLAGILGLGLALAFTMFMTRSFARALPTISVIPRPSEIEEKPGTFRLAPESRIVAGIGARPAAEHLAAQLRKSTGYQLEILSGSDAKPSDISLQIAVAATNVSSEVYDLTVTSDMITARGSGVSGLFYAVQTMLQLFPPEALGSIKKDVEWVVPAVQIHDTPRFAWRGLLLDVGRHFFTKAELKAILDGMALQKLNVLQLHLTDDQGWRVEIKKHPELTAIGAWRKNIGFKLDPKSSTAYGPDGRYGGFYTQEDIHELVAYAKARHITLLPEIEMPGHATAALTAFPALSCTGGPFNTDLDGGVFAGVFCAGNDAVFDLLTDVLDEVIALFPGNYIHIGGDEVPKENWQRCPKCQARMREHGLKTEHELQSWFIKRIEAIVNARGRALVGWSEIREGGLAKNAVVMDWIGGGLEAAREGHGVVMTPTGFCYLDYYQSTNHATEPRAIGGYLPLNKVYSFEPVPEQLAAGDQRHVLGVQGNVWTEYIANLSHAEYMMYPRLCALAEVGWSPANARDEADFNRRLKVFVRRLDLLGINYRKLDISR